MSLCVIGAREYLFIKVGIKAARCNFLMKTTEEKKVVNGDGMLLGSPLRDIRIHARRSPVMIYTVR